MCTARLLLAPRGAVRRSAGGAADAAAGFARRRVQRQRLCRVPSTAVPAGCHETRRRRRWEVRVCTPVRNETSPTLLPFPQMEPRGILRNKDEGHPAVHEEGDLDRQEVIRNTKFNAHLTADATKGDRIRAQIAEAKHHNGEEHLKWDEINLYKTEQEKAATMKIDEPKTPYEGGFDPLGEYYQEDETEAIPAFTLGESESLPARALESLNGGEVIASPDNEEEAEDEEEKEEEILAEEKHRRFEEMRRKHYHLAAAPLHNKVDISDDV